MRIAELDGKRVCILGFGREGQAMQKAMRKHCPGATVTIADEKNGPDYLKNLQQYDVIIKSPGIPPKPEFESVTAKITSSTQIFFDSIEGSGATVIGVTGSKGKSTTSTLIFEILKSAGNDVHLVGNIGEPSIAHVDDAKPGAIFVLEMSSYQLMDLTSSPQIAVITAFFPEHLDYHGSLAAYRDAKAHIARFQRKDDRVVFNALSPEAAAIAAESAGEKIPYRPEDAPVALEETQLIGRHNLGNIAGAWKVAAMFGVTAETAAAAIRAFRPLPHRLTPLGEHHGIRWVDDAISTTPESAIAALDALGDDVVTMILGGQDRGYDFAPLAKRIAASSVRTAILFPGSGPRIRAALGDARADVRVHDADSMESAVEWARKSTMEGKICLLSTASPSYGMFKNFEEKGDAFRRCILGGNQGSSHP